MGIIQATTTTEVAWGTPGETTEDVQTDVIPVKTLADQCEKNSPTRLPLGPPMMANLQRTVLMRLLDTRGRGTRCQR